MDTFIVILALIALVVTLFDSIFGILVSPLAALAILIGALRLNKEIPNTN